MAEINNPEAIRFCNEQVRPLAELLRSLNATMRSIERLWNLGLDAHFANGADTVEDGRESGGVSRMTASHVTGLIGELNSILTRFKEAGVMDIIEYPCVRPFAVGY